MTTGDPITMTSAQLDALDWTAMRSSNVQAIAFEPTVREEGNGFGSLFVRFGSDSVYRYDDVPSEHHERLIEASQDPSASVGTLLHQRVKRSHTCRRITVEADD